MNDADPTTVKPTCMNTGKKIWYRDSLTVHKKKNIVRLIFHCERSILIPN